MTSARFQLVGTVSVTMLQLSICNNVRPIIPKLSLIILRGMSPVTHEFLLGSENIILFCNNKLANINLLSGKTLKSGKIRVFLLFLGSILVF